MICMSILLAPVSSSLEGLGLRRFGCWRRRSNRSRCWSDMRGRGVSRRSRNDHARCLRARRAAGKWQESDVARALDGHAQPALMPRANARHAARQNLPAFLHELGKNVRALVVDEVHLFDAELAHLLFAEILAFAPGPSPGPARATATRPAFAPRTAVPPPGP